MCQECKSHEAENLIRNYYLIKDSDFERFIDLLPKTYWAKYDLSAVKLGWEAHKFSIKNKGGDV